MSRAVRLGGVVALLLSVLSVGGARAQTPPASAPPAVANLASCIQTTGRLSTLIVIDESGSLRNAPGQPGTDPDNQRVAGVKAALTGLGRLADTAIDGNTPKVEVLLAGFASTFETAPGFNPDKTDPFTAVSSDSLPGLLAQADSFAARNTGRNTDYRLALDRARRVLSDRAAAATASGGEAPCRALIFFTDGKYDVVGGDAALRAGREALCAKDGITDQMRRDGVVTFALALSTNIGASDLSFLEALTNGGAQGCGTTGSAATGLFLSVADRDRLIFLFGDLFNPSPTPPTPVGPVCVDAPCPSAAGSFEVVPGVSRFLLRAATGAEGIVVSLTAPNGDTHSFAIGGPPEAGLAGSAVTQRWISPRGVEIDGAISGAESRGTWRFTFLDPSGDHLDARPSYTLQLYADASAQLQGEPKVTLGQPTDLAFQLTDAQGNAVAQGPLAEAAHVTASIIDPSTGRATDLPVAGSGAHGQFHTTFDAPLDSTASSFELRVTTKFDAVGGVEVSSQQRTYELERVLPALYPRVRPSELKLPSAEGTKKTSGKLTIQADERSGGCVWFEILSPDAPSDARGVTPELSPPASTPTQCIRVEPGQHKTATVVFRSGHEASGSVHATVRAHVTSDRNPAEETVDIPVRYELRPTPNVPLRILIFLTLLGIGILIPLLLLHGLNFLSAGFEPPQKVRYAGIDLIVDPAAGLVLPDGEPVAMSYNDTDRVVEEGEARRERSLEVDDISLRAIASGSRHPRSLSLLRGPFGVAGDGESPLVAGSLHQTLRTLQPGYHEVPLALTGTWIFRPTEATAEAGSPRAGRLTVFITDGGSIDQANQLIAAASLELPAALAVLQPTDSGTSVGQATGIGPQDWQSDRIADDPSSDSGGESPGHDI
jgi:hypothetical protein